MDTKTPLKPWGQREVRSTLDRMFGRQHVKAAKPDGITLAPEAWDDGVQTWARFCSGTTTNRRFPTLCEQLPEPNRIRYLRYGADAVCVVKGCGRRPHSRGMCHTHYERSRIGLDVTAPIIPRKRVAA